MNAAELPETGLLTLDEAQKWREELRAAGKQLVVTNGCFDIMHRGHASYLREAGVRVRPLRHEGDLP